MFRDKNSGELKKVSDLFESYRKRLRPPQKSVLRVFVEVVEELLSIQLDIEKLDYSVASKTIHLRVPSPVRSEVKLHEKELLAHLKARLGGLGAPKHLV